MDELEDGFDRLEHQKLVTIETFRDLAEALLAKGRLEAAEIDSCLADENLVRMDWFLANAVGGIKLKVPEEQAAEAFRVLFTDKYKVPAEDEPKCPKCGSGNVNVVDPERGFRLAMLWFIALPMPRVEEVHWKCGQCGARWVEDE
jgi:ribosomal protein S27AE